MWLLLAGAGPMMFGAAGAAQSPAKVPAKGSPDADLLEFLGSLGADAADGWHEYLENTDLDHVPGGAKSPAATKPASPVKPPPARGAAPPSQTGAVKP